jgi:hypothetical protein
MHIKAKPSRNTPVRVYASSQKKDDDEEWILVRTGMTDANGHYVIKDLPKGRYKIVPDLPGYTLDAVLIVEAQEDKKYVDLNFTIDTETKTITKTVEDVPPIPTGVVETGYALSVQVYPNPFAGTLHLTGAEGSVLQVITVNGAVVHTQKVVNPDETISLEKLPAGLYFFRLEKAGKVKTVKAVKQP